MFHTRIITLIAVLAVIGPVSIAEAKTVRYSADMVTSPLSMADGYPGVGGSAFLAGTFESKKLGTGAILDHVSVTSQTLGGRVFTFEGSEVDATDRGMLQSVFTGYGALRDDGVVELFIEGRFTGGTERYRDATGGYEFHGTIPEGSTEATGHSNGRISF